MTARYAVKLAYDGRAFYGSQRQPGVRTVEDEVITGLIRIKAIEGADQARFRSASRTDRGVSALGNVVAFCTDFQQRGLLRAMNSASELVYFYGIAAVPMSFSPRRASRRWYRYFLPYEDQDMEAVQDCAALFIGTHDFRRFCKGDERSPLKKVDQVEVFRVGETIVIDIKAREFLRNMVRRMVAAISEVGSGNATIQEVGRALQGKDKSFGLAPSEPLCLMDVEYPFEFETAHPPTLDRRLLSALQRNFFEMAFLHDLRERCEPRSEP
jgi:tRNA pseudouridine38-40 synthase